MDRERRRTWEDRHRTEDDDVAPSPFVAEALGVLAGRAPIAGRALDLACGRGRHALLLAERGYLVDAVDFAVPALRSLRRTAAARGLTIDCLAADASTWPIPRARYALVLVVNFLDRASFPSLRDAVAPGGALLFETHRRAAGVVSSLRPEFLLAPGELAELGRGWDVLLRSESSTTHRGRPTPRAGILARRPSSPH